MAYEIFLSELLFPIRFGSSGNSGDLEASEGIGHMWEQILKKSKKNAVCTCFLLKKMV
jgi:hypothetical protein